MKTPGQLFDLAGKPSIVTGAAGHIGRTIAGTLAAAGSPTWIVGRTRDPLDSLADEIKQRGGLAFPYVADVTSDEDVEGLARTVRDQHGRLDILVSNAHVARGGTLETSQSADYLEAVELAPIAAQRLILANLPQLRAAALDATPSIITVASMYGVVSPKPSLYDTPETTNPPFYGAAKASLLQLTRYAAVELGPSGIRVNALAPGAFPADLDSTLVGRLRKEIPLDRVGQPDDLATAVLYLASPASRFTTGSTLVIDGGWTAW